MSSNGPLATTFQPAEVRAICQLLTLLTLGGDAGQIARSAPVRNVHAKFLRMRDRDRGEP